MNVENVSCEVSRHGANSRHETDACYTDKSACNETDILSTVEADQINSFLN